MRWVPMHLIRAFALPLAAAVLAAPATPQMSAPASSFDVVRFFQGRTRGEGQLKVVLSPAARVKVEGQGRIEADGTLVLDQLIEREGAEPERRQWRIREVAPGRYRGTLTSARGPVTGSVEGNRLHLRYRLKKGAIDVRQRLDLQAGGREALNRMTLSKLGMPVGALEETIRKVD